MKQYDFKSIKRYIQVHSDLIESVSLGMKEDWWWTAETIYEDSKFTCNLDDQDLTIGGISGSSWATPCMNIIFKDGLDVFKDSYKGESTEQRPEWFQLGCLSSPVQEEIDIKTIPRLQNDK